MSTYYLKAKALALGVPLLLGQIVGAIQGKDTLTWFKILDKPSWCPPIPAFPIVWTILYGFMGYASYLVWTYGGFEAQKGPLMIYGFQLVLNLLWPVIFFKQKKLRLAMFENLALLASVALTANSFWRVDRLAGRLMFPYVAWLVLANALNINLVMRNKSGDQDPRIADLYHDDDKRNPGEQGNIPNKPATAALQLPTAAHARSRGRLVVFAQGTAPRQQTHPIRVVPKFQRARQPGICLRHAARSSVFA